MVKAAEFLSLSNDNSGAPIAILRESGGAKELKIAVSPYDASRLALYNFKLVQQQIKEFSSELIDRLEIVVHDLTIRADGEATIKSIVRVENNGKLQEIVVRPGEGLVTALEQNCPIFIEEELFEYDKKAPSLKEQIRNRNTADFGTSHIQ